MERDRVNEDAIDENKRELLKLFCLPIAPLLHSLNSVAAHEPEEINKEDYIDQELEEIKSEQARMSIVQQLYGGRLGRVEAKVDYIIQSIFRNPASGDVEEGDL